MKRPLTDGQREVLEFLRRTIGRDGAAPTLGEIAAEFGKSTGAVQTMLKALVAKRYIDIVPRKSRGIRLLDRAPAGDRLRGALSAALEEAAEPAALFRAVAGPLAAALGMESGVLWLRDPARRRFVGPAEFGVAPTAPFPEELPLKLQGERAPVVGRSPFAGPLVASTVLVPVWDDDRMCAAVAFASSTPQQGREEELLGLARGIAQLLVRPALRAAAWLSVREDLRFHQGLLDLVRTAGREGFFRRVLELLESVLPADAAWIARRRDGRWEALLEADLDDRDRRVFFPVPRPMEHDPTRIFDGSRGYVLVHRTAEELAHLRAGARAKDGLTPAGNPGRRSASLLFVPIGDREGAISVQSYRHDAYRHADAERLRLVAEYVALAFRLA